MGELGKILGKLSQASDDKPRVLLVSPDIQIHQQVQSALASQNTLNLHAVQLTVIEASLQAADFDGVSAVLMDFNPADAEQVSALREFITARTDNIPVVAITQALDAAGVRNVFQLHVDDWISKPIDPQALVESCERVIKSGRTGVKSDHATCYSFLSASGGVGTTLLAIESAFLIAQKNRAYQSTCLVDLDFQSGSICEYLDLTPNLKFEEIGPSPDRLDPQLMEVMLSRHETNLAVLASKNHLLDPIRLDPNLIARILSMASSVFSTLVIDLPNAWLPFAENALLGSNRVFIISEMTVPAIRRARALVDVLTERFDGDVIPEVIINKHDRALFGNSLTHKDAFAVFGDHFAGFVPLSQKLAREAIDRGVGLYEVDKRNKIDKRLSKILFRK